MISPSFCAAGPLLLFWTSYWVHLCGSLMGCTSPSWTSFTCCYFCWTLLARRSRTCLLLFPLGRDVLLPIVCKLDFFYEARWLLCLTCNNSFFFWDVAASHSPASKTWQPLF
ncbi:hypothetical protein VIGAN_03164100 [Vigna angularis var. angularis]|uniref:Secreted protein n=1 Tax=Vigna angularis var. angularis TaxID=157739 RepID=A0A0S3RMH2_PHAAN|nr:hypothetical protein VIGAN_03164100 [Vigna angularis var. angularis]